MPSFIPDGYTEKGFIKGVDRLYGDLRFTYRPATPDEVGEYSESAPTKRGREEIQFAARFLKGKLLAWDMKDPSGHAVPLTVENLCRVNRLLLLRIIYVVHGSDASDMDPEGAGDGQTGKERLEGDVKN